jgi:AcrR family transcriptional regulator
MTLTSLDPTRPKKKTRFHHGDLRASIIHAVAALIGEKRDLSFQLKEVAALVGTTSPAIYKHFDGRAELLAETALEGYAVQRRFRDHALAQVDDSPISQLLAIGQAYVYFSMRHPGFFLLMKTMEPQEILSSKRYIKERSQSIAFIAGLVQKGIDLGLFSEPDHELVAAALQSTAYGLAHFIISGHIDLVARHHAEDSQFASRVLRASMAAFLSPEGRKHMRRVKVDPFTEAAQ